ncbi:DUF3800 domain-containing protein [Spiroplasma endosymbiont of Polydrusus pterygomalis]|uniref:DUF3800 domain-containing protein n=1 Tax=Spiroplasma endosymbiont of Polydrusus pterygomalis TaxID=3139327 RepID=UPI003CCAAE47
MLKCLILFSIKNKIIKCDNNDIKIFLDNRGKNPFRNELKEYLQQELCLKMLNEEKKLTFNIKYKDSKINVYIRCADLIAYFILKFHENKSIFAKYCSNKMCITSSQSNRYLLATGYYRQKSLSLGIFYV